MGIRGTIRGRGVVSQLIRSLVKILGEGKKIRHGLRNGGRGSWIDSQRNHISGVDYR